MTTNQPSLSNDPNSPLYGHGSDQCWRAGCRRQTCIKAHKGVLARRRAERRRRIMADPSLAPHGVDSTYLTWGCTCDPCVTEHKRVMKAYHAERKEREARWAAIADENRNPTTTASGGGDMNTRNIITFLTSALQAANDENYVLAWREVTNAAFELNAIVLEEAVEAPTRAAKAPRAQVVAPRQASGARKGKKKPAVRKQAPKVTEMTENLIWERFLTGSTPKQLARAFGLGDSTVSRILAAKKKANGWTKNERGHYVAP